MARQPRQDDCYPCTPLTIQRAKEAAALELEREQAKADARWAEERAAAIAADHAQLQSRTATLALVFLVEQIGVEAIEALLDYIDVSEGTAEVRRRLANIVSLKDGAK